MAFFTSFIGGGGGVRLTAVVADGETSSRDNSSQIICIYCFLLTDTQGTSATPGYGVLLLCSSSQLRLLAWSLEGGLSRVSFRYAGRKGKSVSRGWTAFCHYCSLFQQLPDSEI